MEIIQLPEKKSLNIDSYFLPKNKTDKNNIIPADIAMYKFYIKISVIKVYALLYPLIIYLINKYRRYYF